MKRMHQQSSKDSSGRNHDESRRFYKSADQAEVEGAAASSLLLDTLMEIGFSREEATKLSYLRAHLHENAEVRQRLSCDHRLQFARWLFVQGELHENVDAGSDQP